MRWKAREGKDRLLGANDFASFNGMYTNLPTDTGHLQQTLFCLFTKSEQDTICKEKNRRVQIIANSAQKLTLSLDSNGTILKSLVLKGKYKKGYFKVKRQLSVNGLLGPLFWVYGSNISYVGLTKENDIIVLNSGGIGILFILVMPISVSGADQQNLVYKRVQ